MRTRHVVLGSALLSLSLGLVASGRAETTQCTVIAAVPVTIATSGIYCLNSDLDFAPALGTAIRINASNVVLDLNDHTLRGLGGSATTAYGVVAYQRQNVTVKNGTVRGFYYGIQLADPAPYTAEGYVVEDIRAELNTTTGIYLSGHAAIVRRSQVVATGGSTLTASARGITLCSSGSRAIDNDVVTVTKQGAGVSYGIYFCASTADAIALGNRITEADQGIYMAFSTVKYRDNLTTGVAIPYVVGTDAGNND